MKALHSVSRIQHLSLALLVFVLSWVLPAQAGSETLTILFTGDTHNRLEPFFHTELEKSVSGVVRRARYFDQVRQQNPRTLVLDAGDVFQGTPYYNFYLGEPDIKAMGLMRYDAMTVGNHELDNGMLNLRTQVQFAQFPVLNANIVDEKTGLLVFRPFHIFNVHGIRVAVLGLMSEHSWKAIADEQKKGYALKDPFETAQKLVPQLRQQADLVISLHHMGIWDDEVFPQKVADVDLVLGGHSHTLMPQAKLIKNSNQNGLGGTLVQHAYYQGVYVGRIDLNLDAQKKISSYHSELVLLDERFDQEPLKEILSTYGGKLKTDMDQVIGEATDHLSVANKFDGPFPMGSVMADILRESQNTEVGIMNSGGVRAAIPRGPITVRSIYEIMPFDNSVVRFKLRGKDLRQIVETSASRLGKSKTLQFSGLVFTVKDKKVTAITINGKALDPDRMYTVAAPDYVFKGNEDISFEKAEDAVMTGRLLRDVIIAYVRKHKRIAPPSDMRMLRSGTK